ncbi:hypothetical protein ABER98_01785 [Domibacillus aminovorans]|uniref:GTP pyrophosphokinase n=1 Tax=Domibacillus aminovorans TaxID=29332 RepID=UPI003D1E9E30
MKDVLKVQYEEKRGLYKVLCKELSNQLSELLQEKDIKLAVPIEHRVKELGSVIDKIEKYEMDIENISDINDFAGMRIVVLFRRDIETVAKLIEENFEVHRKENTEERLLENQFGYGSIHYEISTPNDWSKVPTLKRISGLKAEIQLRTLTQHSWAASSHVLQYKKEDDVPPPVRRSINRVAALLETVDLEFERVLNERAIYTKKLDEDVESSLNVDTLKNILENEFPNNKRPNGEPYSKMLEIVGEFDIRSVKQLKELFVKHRQFLLDKEEKALKKARKMVEEGRYSDKAAERVSSGVYYTHLAFLRGVLMAEYGKDKVKEI